MKKHHIDLAHILQAASSSEAMRLNCSKSKHFIIYTDKQSEC